MLLGFFDFDLPLFDILPEKSGHFTLRPSKTRFIILHPTKARRTAEHLSISGPLLFELTSKAKGCSFCRKSLTANAPKLDLS